MDDSTSEVTVTENGSPEAQSSEEVTEVGTTNEENIIDESPQDDTASGDTTPEKTGGNLLDKLTSRVKGEFEIYVLIVIFGIWYLYNIGGALMGDEPVFALQGYYFFKGNMPAEQFRPMGRYFFGMGQLFFGRTTFGAKFFVFLLSMCTLYLTYNIGKKLANRHGGLLAAV
ncbi:MAG: hypothetical protein NWE76_01910, partial [Candidatus Bathyarchaeota archaeon]|nr:hypothetical protein [Candidatus Bathyarchaeota archaeon]